MFISYNFDREATDPTNYYFFEKGFSQEELDKIKNIIVIIFFSVHSFDKINKYRHV